MQILIKVLINVHLLANELCEIRMRGATVKKNKKHLCINK